MRKKERRILFLFFIVAFLALFQSGFLAHFPAPLPIPNIIFLFALLYNILEKAEKKNGLWVAFFCGIWYDIFSTTPLGAMALVFLFIAYILKKTLKKYVEIPS